MTNGAGEIQVQCLCRLHRTAWTKIFHLCDSVCERARVSL